MTGSDDTAAPNPPRPILVPTGATAQEMFETAMGMVLEAHTPEELRRIAQEADGERDPPTPPC